MFVVCRRTKEEAERLTRCRWQKLQSTSFSTINWPNLLSYAGAFSIDHIAPIVVLHDVTDDDEDDASDHLAAAAT